jgi:hypothetical protein
MQEDDHPADRIYGWRDQPEEWEVQVLWKTHSWHLDLKILSEWAKAKMSVWWAGHVKRNWLPNLNPYAICFIS